MFIYEKDAKLNIVIDSTNQLPIDNPDISMSKEDAIKILVDGTNIAPSTSDSNLVGSMIVGTGKAG